MLNILWSHNFYFRFAAKLVYITYTGNCLDIVLATDYIHPQTQWPHAEREIRMLPIYSTIYLYLY